MCASLSRASAASLSVTRAVCRCRLFPFITQVIKQGWIQYVSFLLIALWVIDVIKHFVFSQGIVTSVVVNEAGPAPLGAKFPRKLHLW